MWRVSGLFSCHRAAIVLVTLCFGLAGSFPAHAAVTKIDIDAKVTNEGLFVVTETHHLTIEKGYESEFREFGLGVDQAIVKLSITRINEDGSEQPLVDQGAANQDVDGPDQFRYYPRGHVYYRYPIVQQKTPLRYRFEYELSGAISPAWNIAAGDGPLDSDYSFGSPLRRLQEHLATAREAWPAPGKRYRLDHSVLIPGRGYDRQIDLEINYRLEFGTAWREVAPPAEFARVLPNNEYRVRRLYEYLPQNQPPTTAASLQAQTRLRSLLMVLIAGPLLIIAFVVMEFVLFGGRMNAQKAGVVLSSFTPEEVHGHLQNGAPNTSFEQLLARMAGEGKIAIEILTPNTNDDPSEVRLELLVPRESLPKYERSVLDVIFDSDETSTTSDRARAKFKDTHQSPKQRWRELLLRTGSGEADGVPLLMVPPFLAGAWAAFQQAIVLSRDEEVISIVLVNVAALVLTFIFPKNWWHSGMPIRGLFVALIAYLALFGALHLAINRPYPADVWHYSAISILCYFVALLAGSRIPFFGTQKFLRNLSRVRLFAQRELKKPKPELDDRWIYHLIAMGLAPDIERWSQAHHHSLPISSGDVQNQFARPICSSPFTGLPPEPFPGPYGWSEVFELSPTELEEIYGDDEEDDKLDEDDDEENEET